MKTHTIQRLRQAENIPPMPSGLPQDEKEGIRVAPPTPLAPAAGQSVAPAANVAQSQAALHDLKAHRAELDTAYKLDVLKINMEIKRLNALLRDTRQETLAVHDELVVVRKHVVGIGGAHVIGTISDLCARLAVIARKRP